MLIMKSGRGPERAPDFEEFVKTLDDHQIGFLSTLLLHAIEDYGVIEELYKWVANHWLDHVSESRKSSIIPEINARFFTEKAFERYQREMEGARSAGEQSGLIQRPRTGKGKLVLVEDGHGNIIKP